MGNHSESPDYEGPDDTDHIVKWVVLPSGNKIKVVYFETPDESYRDPTEPRDKSSEVESHLDPELEAKVRRFRAALEQGGVRPEDF